MGPHCVSPAQGAVLSHPRTCCSVSLLSSAVPLWRKPPQPPAPQTSQVHSESLSCPHSAWWTCYSIFFQHQIKKVYDARGKGDTPLNFSCPILTIHGKEERGKERVLSPAAGSRGRWTCVRIEDSLVYILVPELHSETLSQREERDRETHRKKQTEKQKQTYKERQRDSWMHK